MQKLLAITFLVAICATSCYAVENYTDLAQRIIDEYGKGPQLTPLEGTGSINNRAFNSTSYNISVARFGPQRWTMHQPIEYNGIRPLETEDKVYLNISVYIYKIMFDHTIRVDWVEEGRVSLASIKSWNNLDNYKFFYPIPIQFMFPVVIDKKTRKVSQEIAAAPEKNDDVFFHVEWKSLNRVHDNFLSTYTFYDAMKIHMYKMWEPFLIKHFSTAFNGIQL